MLVAVDRFFRWRSAMVCGNNRSDKIMKFLIMSNEITALCNGEGIEIIKTPVNNHRATGCVERTMEVLKTQY